MQAVLQGEGLRVILGVSQLDQARRQQGPGRIAQRRQPGVFVQQDRLAIHRRDDRQQIARSVPEALQLAFRLQEDRVAFIHGDDIQPNALRIRALEAMGVTGVITNDPRLFTAG